MVLEHALLSIKPGAERAFEVAFAEAKEIIAGMVGFGRLTLSRCVEQPGTYLLLVEWRRLEDHIEGFRGSTVADRSPDSCTTQSARAARHATWSASA